MESNSHYYSKLVVKEWLTKKWNSDLKHHKSHATFGVLDWTINCSYGPSVYIEYPILKTKYNELLGLATTWVNYPDTTHQNLVKYDLKLEMVFDLMISSDGKPKYGIEIVHTHACSMAKKKCIVNLRPAFKVYEISSTWVMNQLYDSLPGKIPLVEII